MNFTYYNSSPGPTHVLRPISLLISNLIATLSNIFTGCQILKCKKIEKAGLREEFVRKYRFNTGQNVLVSFVNVVNLSLQFFHIKAEIYNFII